MALQLVVNGISYTYPIAGTNPQWGEDASEWAQAVTEVLSNLVGEFDILGTNFSLDNNVDPANLITGLSFSNSVTRSAEISYTIYRLAEDSGAGLTELSETGKINIIRRSTEDEWEFSQIKTGDAQVSFFINSDGTFSYTSSDLPSDVSYQANLTFSAKVTLRVV